MRLRLVSITLALLCMFASSVFGSVVGKITGEVIDVATKEPLVGVSVAVQGTKMGAMTDENGVYTILNVPVGDYVLVLSTVGYATVELSNVSVSADLASYHDMEMTSQATELGVTIQVTAEAPLIVRDKTTTVDVVKRSELLAMPTRGFEDIIGLQNSVVRMNSGNFGQRQRGQRAAQASDGEINLRGGRPSEVAFYVDGFSQQDPLTGLSTSLINNNAIKEISVISGAFSAEYGHVASGIVNVILNEGGDKYSGTIEVVTDQVMKESFDHNYYSADIGGPVPGLDNGYFFFSGERVFLRDRSPSSATKEMHEVYGAPFGLDTEYADNPQRLPSNFRSGWNYQAKLTYNFTPEMKFTLSGNGSVDNWQQYRQEWALNPTHAPRYKDKNLGINAKITHSLSAKTYYNLSMTYFQTDRIRGDGEIFDDYGAYERFYNWADGSGDVSNVVNPEYATDNSLFWTPTEELTVSHLIDTVFGAFDGYEIDSTTTPGVWDTLYTIYADTTTRDSLTLNEESYYGRYLQRKSSYIGSKGKITSQLSDVHTLTAGFDMERHTLRYFEDFDATKGYSTIRVNRYGYDASGAESDTMSFLNNTKNPLNIGLFVQDRIEWRGVVVLAGLRFDLYDYKALKVIDEADPFGGDGILNEDDMVDSEDFKRLSPRLGISFPVTDRTQMHINYGKFYQRPDLIRLYSGYDFLQDRVTAGSYLPFANPALEPEKVTQYEVGMTHQLGDNVAFNVTAYYKSVEDLIQIDQVAPAVPKAYDQFNNVDFGTIKGVDLGIVMRRSRNLRLDLKYTLSYATGTGSYAQSNYINRWQGAEPAKTTNPLDYDQRHSFIGIVDFRTAKGEGPRFGDSYPLENLSLNFIVTAGSGTPYTPTKIYDEATENAVSPEPIGRINSANKPWIFNIDVKLQKEFKVAGYGLTPYLWVKNLLDRDNIIGVYEGTGKSNTNGWLDTDVGRTAVAAGGDLGDYKERYELKQYNPTNWGAPRQIFAGLRVSF